MSQVIKKTLEQYYYLEVLNESHLLIVSKNLFHFRENIKFVKKFLSRQMYYLDHSLTLNKLNSCLNLMLDFLYYMQKITFQIVFKTIIKSK